MAVGYFARSETGGRVERMRCVLYARVSLEEQAEQFGLPSQLRAMRERAAANHYETAEEIVDDGYLGSDLDRPGLGKIRELLKARAVDVVLVHDPDRLSRKLGHHAILLEEFERAGVRLEFITMPVADTPETKMFLNMKNMFSEYEREKIRERTLRGRREKARQGFIVWRSCCIRVQVSRQGRRGTGQACSGRETGRHRPGDFRLGGRWDERARDRNPAERNAHPACPFLAVGKIFGNSSPEQSNVHRGSPLQPVQTLRAPHAWHRSSPAAQQVHHAAGETGGRMDHCTGTGHHRSGAV